MGSVNVKFYADIRGVLGQSSINIGISENDTIDTLINQLCIKYPDSFSKIIYEPNTRQINSAISILLNEVNIYMLEGIKTKLKNNDKITFFAAVSGG